MNRYLFVPFPAYGHIHPMLPVMAELVARGADVRALVVRDFVDVVRRTGARPVVLPAEFEVHVPDRSLLMDGPRRFAARMRRFAARRATAKAVVAELAAEPAELAVVDSMASWADRAAARSAVPRVLFSTTFTRRSGRPVVVNAIPELQPKQGHLVSPLIRTRDTVSCDLPWDLIRGCRTLLVSPGTVFARKSSFFRAVVDAFAESDWVVVAASGALDPRELGPLPTNVVVRRQVPQLAVLAHSQAFVTHGGMNSVLESLAAGVPMVLAPRSSEQRATCRRLAALGAGVPLSLRSVRHQVESVSHDPVMRRVLDGFRGLSDPGQAGVVADFLQELIWTGARSAARTST